MADFYPASMDERVPWHVNFAKQITEFAGAKYGLGAGAPGTANNDRDWIIFWVQARNDASALNQQLTKYFNNIAGNNTELAAPEPIDWTLSGSPPDEVPPGIEARTRAMARQIKGHQEYSNADGELLGIVAPEGDEPDLATFKPGLTTHPALHGFMFSAVVSGREASDQWQVFAAEVGSSDWKVLGTFTGKSGDVTWPDGTDKPVQLQVYVQLRKNNANYGQPSDIVLTTVNP